MKDPIFPNIGTACNVIIKHEARAADGTLTNITIESLKAFISRIETDMSGKVTVEFESTTLVVNSAMKPGKALGLYSLSVEDPPKVKRKRRKLRRRNHHDDNNHI